MPHTEFNIEIRKTAIDNNVRTKVHGYQRRRGYKPSTDKYLHNCFFTLIDVGLIGLSYSFLHDYYENNTKTISIAIFVGAHEKLYKSTLFLTELRPRFSNRNFARLIC